MSLSEKLIAACAGKFKTAHELARDLGIDLLSCARLIEHHWSRGRLRAGVVIHQQSWQGRMRFIANGSERHAAPMFCSDVHGTGVSP